MEPKSLEEILINQPFLTNNEGEKLYPFDMVINVVKEFLEQRYSSYPNMRNQITGIAEVWSAKLKSDSEKDCFKDSDYFEKAMREFDNLVTPITIDLCHTLMFLNPNMTQAELIKKFKETTGATFIYR